MWAEFADNRGQHRIVSTSLSYSRVLGEIMSKKSVAFGKFLKSRMADSTKLRKWLRLGVELENFKRKYVSSLREGEFLKTVNWLALEEVVLSLRGEGKASAWVNLLAPSELLLPLNINPVAAEGIAGVFASMRLEGYLTETAARSGIADSLCTFHRASLGATIRKIFPPPRFVMATSVLCDGNLPTFKRIAREYGVPFLFIDVPRGRSKSSLKYVLSQLREVIASIEEITGRDYPMDELSDTLARERETVENLDRARRLMCERYLPQELYEHMNALYVMHTLAGDERLLRGSRKFEEELVPVPEEAVRILWLHIPPYYDSELFEIFSKSTPQLVVGNELMWDWLYPVNPLKPLESLAEKLVFNPLCGNLKDRGNFCLSLAEDFRIDGALHYTHWGCRQSAGGVGYLKELFEKRDIPLIELTGDCVDHTSQGAGQARTRVEAFSELLRARR